MSAPTRRGIERNHSLKRFGATLALVLLGILDGRGEPLKVLNWNVLYGFNHGSAVQEAATWLHEQAPDVVALQELNGLSQVRLGALASAWGHDHAVTHKESGFPVGLTSGRPIEVLAREVDGLHHGFLHAKTHGAHFFVVHFWPGKPHDVSRVLTRAAPLLENGESVFILGDFNGCSRRDETFLKTHATMREIDYTFTDMVEDAGFIDLIHQLDPKAKVSCPSPITIPRWTQNLEELAKKQYRIDFLFADRRSASKATTGTILRSPILDGISDHYPMSATVEWGGKTKQSPPDP